MLQRHIKRVACWMEAEYGNYPHQQFRDARCRTVAPESAPARLFHRFTEWRLKQRVYREMGPMTDRDLADLGITRLDVDRIANGEDVRAD